jgi:hypothetical protein
MSILNPSQSVGVGIGIAAVDLLIFQMHLPPITDIRTASPTNPANPAKPGNPDVETARRQAVMYCVGINGLISLITRDWNVFLIGGIATVSMSYISAHANAVNPLTGKMAGATQSLGSEVGVDPGFAMQDYGMQADAGDTSQ